jgi:hypothetical protein
MKTTYRVHLIAVREDSPVDKSLGYFLDKSGEDGVDGLEFRGNLSGTHPFPPAFELAHDLDDEFDRDESDRAARLACEEYLDETYGKRHGEAA